MTKEEFQNMDIPTINNAITVSGFPREINDWIWQKKRTAFEVF